MLRLLFLLLLVLAAPAAATQGRPTHIQPQLIVDGPIEPGQIVNLAIVMTPDPGWHGYWINPGDAGYPMQLEWTAPKGLEVGPLLYPVPTRLSIAGLMNYVYEGQYAILTRLKVPADATGTFHAVAMARWLACTDKVCVPETGLLNLRVKVGESADESVRFDLWRRALPRPLASSARFELAGNKLRVAIPLPASVGIGEPYVFPISDGPVDYAAPQSFRRSGDTLIAELQRHSGEPREFAGVLALGDGRGLEFRAQLGAVPGGGTRIAVIGGNALLLALLGALVGGILLNLMPCVFPILALKALHLAKSGGDERAARRDALGYAAGAVVGTGALGIALLAIRAGGSAAGWAFQLQDPRTILLLALLATAITLNLLRVFELPVIGGERNPAGSFGTGALAAFVATPCAGPFLGAALGTALLLPAVGSIAVFAALGLGLALPFVIVAFVPALRSKLPKPGPWMVRFQRILAVPMALTALACLWLLWRQGGTLALEAGLLSVIVITVALGWIGSRQRRGQNIGVALLPIAFAMVAGTMVVSTLLSEAVRQSPKTARNLAGAKPWSDATVSAALAKGRPVFVYFTADWCLTCKVNEAGAIDRDSVQAAFRKAGVVTLVGDWTNGDPAITRLLDSRGRAGVPLYLWYEPGKPEPEELPQVLTPSMLSERASRAR